MRVLKMLYAARTKLVLHRLDEWHRIEFFRSELGLSAGQRVRITGQVSWGSEPYLVRLGNDVTIADGVRFVTHDGGVAVFRRDCPGLNVYDQIVVGNNVFIGVNAILMPGIKIGDNVVIGAGSVVTNSLPNDVVAAGNPARVIRTLAEYRERVATRSVTVGTDDPVNRRHLIMASVAATSRLRDNGST
ncbi:MAG: hypothetical protein QOH16_2153 [Gaiellaceae bacterium]|nr:hypothetical protein [Gaiellaceae bacterium]